MSYNGSGLFQINTSGQPVVAGTVITASAFNALTADLATGLTTAITKDGQTATTAQIPFAQGLRSTLTTDSTNSTSGSIITDGGLGVAKAVNIGTTLTVTGAGSIQGLTVGKGAGAVATNTAVGASALAGSNSGTGNNTALGYQSLLTNSTGYNLVGLGYQALNLNTTGYSNVGVGGVSLGANTTGNTNTAVGHGSMVSNTTGSSNTALGFYSLLSNTTGAQNTAVGYQAGYSATSGTYNTFVGNSAGNAITTGGKNTILGGYGGNQGGLDIRTASNYIVLSDGDGIPAAYRKTAGDWWFGVGGTGSDNQGVITLNGNAPAAGNGAYINGLSNGTAAWAVGSYRAIVSGTATWFTCANSGGGGVYLNGASATAWTAVSSDARQKKDFAPVEGLAEIMQVVPTKFRYEWETEADPIHMGFTAQNLLPIIPDMVVIKEELHEDGTPLMTVTPDYMIPVLVKAIQELKAEFDAYKAAHP